MSNPSLKFSAIIHLALYCSAVAWFMPSESFAQVVDQLNETLEFIFSTVPLQNFYMLKDSASEAYAVQLIAIFFVTAIPCYLIGFPLFMGYFNKPRY